MGYEILLRYGKFIHPPEERLILGNISSKSRKIVLAVLPSRAFSRRLS